MLDFARSLCSTVTGSHCRQPALSDWALVAPTQSSIGVDVADLVTGGATTAIPLNVNAYGSSFSSGLERRTRHGGMSSQMTGLGVGLGAGPGWGIPVGGRGLGRMPDSVKKKVIEKAGGAMQGKIEELLRSAIFEGVSGGTRLVKGPDCAGELTTSDFHGSFATIASFGANFAVNGVTFGIVFISKNRPVVRTGDLLHARAIGLMGGVGLATSLDLEVSGMAYHMTFM